MAFQLVVNLICVSYEEQLLQSIVNAMKYIALLLLSVFALFSCVQSSNTPTGKLTAAKTSLQIDANRWDIKDYKGLLALQCTPRKCRNFERIVFLATILGSDVHDIFSKNSLNREEAKRLVGRLAPEHVNTIC